VSGDDKEVGSWYWFLPGLASNGLLSNTQSILLTLSQTTPPHTNPHTILSIHSTFRAATVRLLRLASNAFIASTDLVLRTMGEFAPDADEPRITDEELAAEAKKSHTEWESTKGIELPGAPDEPRR